MRFFDLVKAVGAAIALGALSVGTVQAQQQRGDITFEAQAGVAFPAGDLADVADVGGTAGGTVGYQFHPMFGWRAGVEGIFLNDTRDVNGVVPAPAMTMIHFTTGPEVVFSPPSHQDVPMTFRFFAAGGGASVDATESFSDGSSVDFDNTYFVLNFGGAAGYRVTPTVSVFVDSRAYLFFFDEQDTDAFADRSQFVEPFSRGLVIPVTVGVRLLFQP